MMKILKALIISALLSFFLGACDNNSSTDSGGGQAEVESEPEVVEPNLTEAVVGPNLNGDNWVGYYKSAEGKYEPMTAVIRHVGNQVTIQSSLRKEGVASELSGKISASGKITLYDAYDNEDWTTLYGPVSKNSINLADFVFINGHKADTNVIILKR